MEQSPFANLPAEIRSPIWVLALEQPKYHLSIWQGIRSEPPSLYPYIKARRPLALTLTCKAIRAEARLLFFSANEFTFNTTWQESLPLFNGFLTAIGSEAEHALGSVVFLLYDPSPNKFHGQVDILCELRRFALQHPRCKVVLCGSSTYAFGSAHLDLAKLTAPWEEALTRGREIFSDWDEHIENWLRQYESWRQILAERVPAIRC